MDASIAWYPLPTGPIYLDGDAARLAQVFSNILNNAAKFTDAGRPIKLRVTLGDNVAVFRGIDDGVPRRIRCA